MNIRKKGKPGWLCSPEKEGDWYTIDIWRTKTKQMSIRSMSIRSIYEEQNQNNVVSLTKRWIIDLFVPKEERKEERRCLCIYIYLNSN